MTTICYLSNVPDVFGNATRVSDGFNLGSDPTLAELWVTKATANSSSVLHLPHENSYSVRRVVNDGFSIHLGGGDPAPERFWSLDPIKIGRSSPGWGTSRYTGAICVTPYYKRTCTFTPAITPLVEDAGPCDLWGSSLVLCNDHGDSSCSTLFNGYPKHNGQTVIGGTAYSGYTRPERRHGRLLGWTSPYDSELNKVSLKRNFTKVPQTLLDTSLVQGCVAKANERSLDVLTTVMELPETILSIGRTFLNVRGSITRWISRDKQLTARRIDGQTSFDRRRRAIQSQIDEVLADAYRQDKRARRGLQVRINRARKRMKKLLKEQRSFQAKIADEASSLWLRLRYEILPIVYTCQDVAESAQALSRVYQTERTRLVEEAYVPTFPGWDFQGERTVTWRCMVKYMYQTDGDLEDVRKAFSANAFLTAWELGTLTFVLDWFFSVGDFLSAKFGKPSLVTDSSVTVSNRVSIKGSYTKTNGASVAVDYSHYERSVVDPLDFLGIFPLINLNWQRLVDSSALLWGQLTRHFKK